MKIQINKKIIIVPAVIYSQLSRNNLTFDDILNLDKIIDCFSIDDLSFMYCINESNSIIYNQNNIPNYLLDYWAGYNDSFAKVFSSKDLQLGNVDIRLAEEFSIKENNLFYELKDTQHDVIFCVVYPNMFVSKEITKVASLEITTTILKLLYDYNDYNMVASHPLYSGWIANIN